MINDSLKRFKNILKEPTINNKKFLINNILNDNNKKTTFKEPKINNNNNTLKEPKINNNNNTLKEPKTNNNKPSTIMNDNLEKPKINKKLTSNEKLKNQSAEINKEPETNNNLEKTINNYEEPKINIAIEPTIINDNSEEPKINKEPETNKNLEKTINNLEEPKINNNILNEPTIINDNSEQPKINILNEQSRTINNLEEPKINNYVKTPEFLISKKIIINPLTTKDTKSFLDSVTLSLHHKTKGKNNTRPNKIRKYNDTFNWKNINFLPTEKDYKQFEIDNKEVNLNILAIKGDEKEIDYIYKSQFEPNRKYKLNLLLLEKKHYTCVKDLDSLLVYSSESESESKS